MFCLTPEHEKNEMRSYSISVVFSLPLLATSSLPSSPEKNCFFVCPLVMFQDVRVLFLVSSAVVFVSALGVHFKLGKIYNALLYSYTTGTDRKEDFMQFLAPDLLVGQREFAQF